MIRTVSHGLAEGCEMCGLHMKQANTLMATVWSPPTYALHHELAVVSASV